LSGLFGGTIGFQLTTGLRSNPICSTFFTKFHTLYFQCI